MNDIPNKILVIRTDRIGDVMLSTPVIKALRDAYPTGYIAMMVRPYARDIVIGNPHLNEVVLYDKDGIHKSVVGTAKFIWQLRKKRFDTALILHPTNRAHIISFLAGIEKRIGYRRKCGFLLTEKLEDKKHLGEKHEIEYNLDVVRAIGIEAKETTLFMPLRSEDEQIVDGFLKEHILKGDKKLIAIHPGASCPSKIWPPEKFAQVGDTITKDHNATVIIVTGPHDREIGQAVVDAMHHKPIFVSGDFTLGQVASLLHRSSLFISNDSGPVHIAVAVGTPVVAIFGRNQAGLNPTRWRPTGERDIILHKDVGCKVCMAHHCHLGFKCLNAITVTEVLQAAEKILRGKKERIP